jgi:hypothetical protein
MKKNHFIVMLFFSIVLAISAVMLIQPKFPKDEAQSRSICLKRIGRIRSSLLIYLDGHDGIMPIDLFVLIAEKRLKRRDLVCPSSYKEMARASAFQEDCALYITSYRLLTPNKKFKEIPDDTIIVQEIVANHRKDQVGDKMPSEGYYVLLKKSDDLIVQFKENGE